MPPSGYLWWPPKVAAGMMWLLILEPNIGMANYVLQNLGLPGQGFLSI